MRINAVILPDKNADLVLKHFVIPVLEIGAVFRPIFHPLWEESVQGGAYKVSPSTKWILE